MTRARKLFGPTAGKRYGKSDEWLLNHKPELVEHAKEREAKARQKLEEMKLIMKGAKDVEPNLQ